MQKGISLQAYPKPGAIGGRLIREIVSFLRSQEVSLPLQGTVWVAVSGGADSLALAHLLGTYGRRVVEKKNLRLIHINHRWRGKDSDEDARFVKDSAKGLGLPIQVKNLSGPPSRSSGRSWEEHARQKRKAIFHSLTTSKKAWLLTAHQAEDLAETLLWRLFTGGAETHGGGILACHGQELRPLLRVRKTMLQTYLKEEGLSWREDSTNYDPRFLRARMRLELFPVVEKLFPRATQRLVELALKAQQSSEAAACDRTLDESGLLELLGATGIQMRRPHWKVLQSKLASKIPWVGEIHLPGGWILEKRPPESGSKSLKGQL